MPEWRPIQRTWDALRERFDLRSRIGEMLTGVIPVVVAEQHWPAEQLDFFGLNAVTDEYNDFFVADGNPHHLYIELQAGELEVLIWRIEAQTPSGSSQKQIPAPVHIFTPLQDYGLTTTPAPNGLEPNTIQPALYFPWLQPVPSGVAGLLPQTFSRAGATEGLQVVSVNGIPTTSIGPIWQTIGGIGFGGNLVQEVVSGDGMPKQGWSCAWQPPIRLRPNTRIAVQTASSGAAGLTRLEANFVFSEREFEPGR